MFAKLGGLMLDACVGFVYLLVMLKNQMMGPTVYPDVTNSKVPVLVLILIMPVRLVE